mmetsp:Transcript_10331/g.18687  ORF Transcript_10331/g.18687 Transcript_10331/m.18687 type:complete len:220 (+) Transcript_10331:533-1192(+)
MVQELVQEILMMMENVKASRIVTVTAFNIPCVICNLVRTAIRSLLKWQATMSVTTNIRTWCVMNGILTAELVAAQVQAQLHPAMMKVGVRATGVTARVTARVMGTDGFKRKIMMMMMIVTAMAQTMMTNIRGLATPTSTKTVPIPVITPRLCQVRSAALRTATLKDAITRSVSVRTPRIFLTSVPQAARRSFSGTGLATSGAITLRARWTEGTAASPRR